MSLDLDAIDARAEAATPGPWVVVLHQNGYHVEGRPVPDPFVPGRREQIVYVGHQADALAEFIAHARTDIPLLLAEIKLLRPLAELTQVPGRPVTIKETR